MAVVLNISGRRPHQDLAMKFLEHFAAISDALDELGLWDDTDGFYYDRLKTPGGEVVPVKVRSMVGIIPAMAAAVIGEDDMRQSFRLGKRFADFLVRHGMTDGQKLAERGLLRGEPGQRRLLLSLCGPDRLERLFARLFDESEFLSPHGLRALSAYHRDHPYQLRIGDFTASVDYEPAESTTSMFGGNSNWRGPVWFPLNYLIVSFLERYHRFYGDDYTIEYPAGSGRQLSLDKVAADLSGRLISLFTRGPDGRRPCFGGTEIMQADPAWRDNLIYSEYFHGDNGAAIGAFHQTGWTGVVADLIRRRHGDVAAIGDVIRSIRPRLSALCADAQAAVAMQAPCDARRVVLRRHEPEFVAHGAAEVVAEGAGLGDDAVHDALAGEVEGPDALARGEFSGMRGVLVDDRAGALRRQRGEPGVLGGQHPVGGQQGQRAAAGAFPEQDRYGGRPQVDQRRDALGDLAGHAVLFGFRGEVGSWRVDHGDERDPELFGEEHAAPRQPQCGGARRGPGAVLGDEHAGAPAGAGEREDQPGVVQPHRVGGDGADQPGRARPARRTGAEHRLPGRLPGRGRLS